MNKLKEQAEKLIKKSTDNITFRSCWNCNGSHEHLKESKFVINCFECGNWFFKGKKITDENKI